MPYDVFNLPQDFPTFQNSLIRPWNTRGSAVTNKPQILLEPLGTVSTGWSTSGTAFGINAPSSFSGNLVDLQLNGTSVMNVDYRGIMTLFPTSLNHLAITAVNGTASQPIYIAGRYASTTIERCKIAFNGASGSSIQLMSSEAVDIGGSFTSGTINPNGNVLLRGYIISSNANLSFTIRPIHRDEVGGYSGNGYDLNILAGRGDINNVGGNCNISGGDAKTASLNKTGGYVTINGGINTGSASGGSIIFKTSSPGSSGTSLSTLSTRMTIDTNGLITLGEGVNFASGTTTGTQICTSTSQKLGFFGVTPVVQQVLATGTSKTVDDVITFLQTIGLCKQS